MTMASRDRNRQYLGDFAVVGDRDPDDGTPDAVSQPCTNKTNSSSALSHIRLGSYTAQELMDTRCDEPLLVMLSRQLQWIGDMEDEVPAKRFRKLFPLEFAKNSKRKSIRKNAVEGSLALAGVSALKALDIVDNGGMDIYSAYTYGEYVKNELKHVEKEAVNLVTKGAKFAAPFWQDVPLGIVMDVYASIKRRWAAKTCAIPIVTQKTALLSTLAKRGQTLTKGTFVNVLDPPVEEAAPGPGYIYVGIYPASHPQGWIEEALVAPGAWFVAKKRVKLCKYWEEDCRDEDAYGYIEKDEKVKR